MKNNLMVIAILVALIAAGGGFFAGMKYQQGKSPKGGVFGNFQGPRGQMGAGTKNGNDMRNNGFKPVNGEIIESDEKSITVKLVDGSSKIVIINDKTSINKASEGVKDDLRVGEKVAVFGQTNSDGTVTAENVQLNPLLRGISSPEPGL